MEAVSSERCIGPITDTNKYSALICLKWRSKQGLKGKCVQWCFSTAVYSCHFPSGKWPGYGGTWHCPPLRDAKGLIRTFSGHYSPRTILAAEIGLFCPWLNSSKIHATVVLCVLSSHNGLERSKNTYLLRKHRMGHTQLHSLGFPEAFVS